MHNNQLVLVTGINGFVGHHLARELKNRGFRVIGAGLDPSLHKSLKNYVEHYYGNCDLTKPADVKSLPLSEVVGIINLAGLAQMGASFTNDDLYMKINVGVHTTIAERLLSVGKTSTRMVSVSSGAIYDNNRPMPLNENSKLAAGSSPYSRSKVAMEKAMSEYRAEGLDIIVVRPFNHIGPGQAKGFLLPDLFEKIANGKGEIKVGNLETTRDYTDVRDVVRAYVDLLSKDKLEHNTYNVCSGTSVSGMQILEKLKTAMGRDDLTIKVDETLFRPSDAPVQYGDNSRLSKETGWLPSISLDQTIEDFVAERSS